MQRTILIPLAVVAVLVCTVYTRAAELRLKPKCQISGAVVTLGDVADIFTTDQKQADTLAAVELFPTPAPSQQRFVRLREIQDLLFSHGVNLAEHRFSGSSQVAVTGVGRRPPRTGKQRFEATVHTADGPARFPIDAEVSPPPEFVVAVHSLSRGVVIRETDVELCSVASKKAPPDAFHTINEVIGTETTQAVPNGKVLRSEMVRRPLMVRRGEVVTVTARRAGIRIRTTARARDDGSRGETVVVESLLDRTRYFTRVVAVRKVEVCSTGLAAASARRASF